MTKPLQAGHAAESGVQSVQLADIGWTAATQILEAQRGFFHAAGGSFDSAAILGKLGAPWSFAAPGISLNPHPSGSLSHPAITPMLPLTASHPIPPAPANQAQISPNHPTTP